MNNKEKYVEGMIKDIFDDNLASAQKNLSFCVEENLKERMKELATEEKK